MNPHELHAKYWTSYLPRTLALLNVLAACKQTLQTMTARHNRATGTPRPHSHLLISRLTLLNARYANDCFLKKILLVCSSALTSLIKTAGCLSGNWSSTIGRLATLL